MPPKSIFAMCAEKISLESARGLESHVSQCENVGHPAEYMNSSCNPQQIKDHSFTGQNEDTVSGLDDFMFREFSASQQGRWISPDPAGLAAANVADPQSWNRYAYVLNGPLASVDPLGFGPCQDIIYFTSHAECSGGGPGAGGGLGLGGGGLDAFAEALAGYLLQTNSIFNGWSGYSNLNCAGAFGSVTCYAGGEAVGTFTYAELGIGQSNAHQGGNGAGPNGGAGAADPCSSAANAPSPKQYQAMGYVAQASWLIGPGVGGLSNAGALAMFKRGLPLDAQVIYGSSQAYANYAFGVFTAAAGYSLNFALWGANAYASSHSSYPQGTPMDANYPSTPAANVTNITNGYNAQRNGTLCSLAKAKG